MTTLTAADIRFVLDWTKKITGAQRPAELALAAIAHKLEPPCPTTADFAAARSRWAKRLKRMGR